MVGAMYEVKVRQETEVLEEAIMEDKYVLKVKETLKTVRCEYYWDEEEHEEVEREVEVLDETSVVQTKEFDLRGFTPIVNINGEVVAFAKGIRGRYLVHDNSVLYLTAKVVILRPYASLYHSQVGVLYTTYKNNIVACVTSPTMLTSNF